MTNEVRLELIKSARYVLMTLIAALFLNSFSIEVERVKVSKTNGDGCSETHDASAEHAGYITPKMLLDAQ